MKTGIAHPLLLAAALLGLASCKKPAVDVAVEPEPVPVAAATPAPATPPPIKPLAAITPVPELLAPPGIYFLIQKASIVTDDGIIGLKPGQGLRQVSPGTYEANGQTVQLRDDQVTNNLRIARKFAAADAASQTALRQALHPPPPKAPAATPVAVAVSATPPQPSSRPPSAQGTLLSGGSRLGAGTGVADPETANRKNVKLDSSGRYYWRDSRGAIRYDF
jgi:hypothetical protein